MSISDTMTHIRARTGYQSTRHMVISSVHHLVTRPSRHRSTHHTHVSSHSQLVTSKHITNPPVPVVIICTPSRDIQKQCSTRTAHICVTLMYTARRQITLLRKARSTRHNAVKHNGQLVTWFYDVTSWPCDELTGSPRTNRRRYARSSQSEYY